MPTKETTETDERPVQGIDVTLCELQNGGFMIEASQEFTRLIQAVRQTGKKGSITLTLNLKKVSRGDTPALEVQGDIKVKVPTAERSAALYFATDENLLVHNDPRQAKLLFEEAKPVLVEHKRPEPIDRQGAAANDR